MTSPSTKNRGKVPIVSTYTPILEGTLPSTEPLETDYSQKSYHEFLDSYSPENYMGYFHNRRPLIEHEMLCNSGSQFSFLRGNTARGKSEVICAYTLNETLKNDSHALVLSHTRGLAEELKEKFAKYMKILGDDRQIVSYYKDTELKNEQIREEVKEEKDQVAVFIMTPFMLLGSFTSFSLMGCLDHQEILDEVGDRDLWGKVFSSSNIRWAKKLSSPSIVVIDEVDSYPLPALLCLSIFVRLLIWKNPDIKIILSSATVSNPDFFATLFFGPQSDYLDLIGLGRRGKTKINVYYEEEPKKLLEYHIDAIKEYIQAERKKMRPGKRYVPRKVILFLNNKRYIDIKKLLGMFSQYFITVHGDMSSEKVAKRINQFRRNPLKVCLVATSIIQAGLDVPDASWVIFDGIPQSGREYLQQRGRANRISNQKGKIDIILRATNAFEKEKAANINDLAHFIFQEKPPPLRMPLYTPLTLQYAISMGVVFGYWNILELLKDNFYGRSDPSFIQDLELAYINLLQENVVSVGTDEMILPTNNTKQWIHNFPKKFSKEVYRVVLRKKNSNSQDLGTISLSELFRKGLPSQTLVYIDDTYKVDEIDTRTNTVYMTEGFLELYDIKNKIEKTITTSEIIAYDFETDVALVEVIETERVAKIDTRTRSLDLNNVPLAQSAQFGGLFLKRKITLPVEKKIRKICDILNIDRSMIRSTQCYHEELGSGTLLIDNTKLGIASMIYSLWVQRTSRLNKMKKKDKKAVNIKPLCQENQNRFHRYLVDYRFTVACVADLHLNGCPIIINGKEIDFQRFCYTLIKPLQNVSVIIFLGDTIDKLAAQDFTIARDQLFTLFETLDYFGLIHKTIFIRGNHDYDMCYFRWRKPINTSIAIRWSLKPYQDLICIHGDNTKMEKYLINQEVTHQDIQTWRENITLHVNETKARKKDFIISGHLHRGFLNRKQYSMGVPSVKNYWLSPQKEKYGWIGLFCHGTFDNHWDCLIAIEDPYKS